MDISEPFFSTARTLESFLRLNCPFICPASPVTHSAMSGLSALLNCDDFEAAASELGAKTSSAELRGALANVSTAACDGVTLARNRAAFRDRVLVPRVLVDVSRVSTAATILGRPVAQPFGIAPSAYQRLVHADGELGMTRAAIACGVPHCLSSVSSTSLEDVASEAAGRGIRFQQARAMVVPAARLQSSHPRPLRLNRRCTR